MVVMTVVVGITVIVGTTVIVSMVVIVTMPRRIVAVTVFVFGSMTPT